MVQQLEKKHLQVAIGSELCRAHHHRNEEIPPLLRGRPILLTTRMITDRIGLHSVLLPLFNFTRPHAITFTNLGIVFHRKWQIHRVLTLLLLKSASPRLEAGSHAYQILRPSLFLFDITRGIARVIRVIFVAGEIGHVTCNVSSLSISRF